MKRRLWKIIPKISYANMRNQFPHAGKYCWDQWFSWSRCWGGRIIHLRIKAHTVTLDFRYDWVADMKNQPTPTKGE